MSLSKNQDLVQALLARRADPAFRERIRIWRLDRRADDRDTLRSEYGIEGRRKLGVPVVEQEADGHCSVLDLPTETTRVLRHPRRRWTSCTSREMHPPASQLNKEEDIQRFQPCRLNGEEVTREHLVLVVPQERTPAAAALRSVRCWWNLVSFEDIPHGREPNVVAELAQFTLQLAIAPRRVLLHQAEDQGFTLRADGRPAAERPIPEGPLSTDQLAVPCEQGLRFEQQDKLAQPGAGAGRHHRQFTDKDNQGKFLPTGNARWVGLLALEDAQLLAEQQDLEILVMVGLANDSDEIEQERQDKLQEKEHHASRSCMKCACRCRRTAQLQLRRRVETALYHLRYIFHILRAVVRHRRQFADEDEQYEFLPARDAGRVGLFPLEDTQLLAQQENFDVFVTFGSASHGDKVEQK
jgi:hypothetical protein